MTIIKKLLGSYFLHIQKLAGRAEIFFFNKPGRLFKNLITVFKNTRFITTFFQ